MGKIELLDIDSKVMEAERLDTLIGSRATAVLTAKQCKNGAARFDNDIFVDESREGIPIVGLYRLL
jgi:hypothetical protein